MIDFDLFSTAGAAMYNVMYKNITIRTELIRAIWAFVSSNGAHALTYIGRCSS